MDTHAVIDFVALLKTSQYRDCILDRRLIDHNRLETTFKSGVLLDILPVFVQSGGADAVQLAPCKHGLQEVACVHAALGLACADYSMKLINEEQDLALGLLDLLEDGLQPLFKLASVFSAGYKSAHIKAEYCLILQPLGHVSPDYPLGKSLGYSGFTYAGLAYQDGVILSLSRKNTDDVPYLGVTTDNGVKLVIAGTLDKVGAVFCEGIVSALGVIARYGAALDLGESLGKSILCDAVGVEYLPYLRGHVGEYAEHQMLN